jgi:hypothetical protein
MVLTVRIMPGTGARRGVHAVNRRYSRCLAFCDAIHEHHMKETGRGFPLLEERCPGLEPVLAGETEAHVDREERRLVLALNAL